MGRKQKTNLDLFGDDAVGGLDTLKVNEKFASRFEHNNKRKELHQLQAKHPEQAARLARSAGIDLGGPAAAAEQDESSTSDDEDEGVIPEQTNQEMLELIMKLRQKDPSIYDPEAKFYSQLPEDDGADGAKPKQEKAVYLKDMVAKQALAEAAGEGGDESDEEGRPRVQGKIKAYDEEQRTLRAAFLDADDAADDADGNDGFGGMSIRSRGVSDADAGSEQPGRTQELLDKVFGAAKEDEKERFLKDFLAKERWRGSDDDEDDASDEDDDPNADIDHDVDEGYIEQADKFEASYNFRHEDPSAATGIVQYPRDIDGTARRKDTRRATARRVRKERLEEAERQRAQEVKRLKNLKRGEIEAKLGKVEQIAGHGMKVGAMVDELLKGDFDPETWDAQMAKAFDADYYDDEEAAAEGIEDILDEELMAAMDAPGASSDEGEGEERGFGALHESLHGSTAPLKEEVLDVVAPGPDGEADAQDGDNDMHPSAEEQARIQTLLQEYHKLDCEDTIGGLKTRFRYKPVPKAHYGLGIEDILGNSDRALNGVVGIKRLAPYRDDEGLTRPSYKALKELTGREDVWTADKLWTAKGAKEGEKKRKKGKKRGDKHDEGDKGKGKRKNTSSEGGSKQKMATGGKKSRVEQPAREPEEAGEGKHDRKKRARMEEVQEEDIKKHKKSKRMASYAKPELKLPGASASASAGDATKKSKNAQKQAAPSGADGKAQDGPKLTKAQKKNLARARKRAERQAAAKG